MADIKQAAKWMQEGHVVKRPHWLYEDKTDGVRKNPRKDPSTGTLLGRVGFQIDDLLADDWEIAEDDDENQ